MVGHQEFRQFDGSINAAGLPGVNAVVDQQGDPVAGVVDFGIAFTVNDEHVQRLPHIGAAHGVQLGVLRIPRSQGLVGGNGRLVTRGGVACKPLNFARPCHRGGAINQAFSLVAAFFELVDLCVPTEGGDQKHCTQWQNVGKILRNVHGILQVWDGETPVK